jgi:hypothetical protein
MTSSLVISASISQSILERPTAFTLHAHNDCCSYRPVYMFG